MIRIRLSFLFLFAVLALSFVSFSVGQQAAASSAIPLTEGQNAEPQVLEVPLTSDPSVTPKEEQVLEVPVNPMSKESPSLQAKHAKDEYRRAAGHGWRWSNLNPSRLSRWLSRPFRNVNLRKADPRNAAHAAQDMMPESWNMDRLKKLNPSRGASSYMPDWHPMDRIRNMWPWGGRGGDSRDDFSVGRRGGNLPNSGLARSPFFSSLWQDFDGAFDRLWEDSSSLDFNEGWGGQQSGSADLWDLPHDYSLYEDPMTLIATRGEDQKQVSTSAGQATELLSATWQVKEHSHYYDIVAKCPGWDRDELNVDVKDGYLTLTGERRHFGKSDLNGGEAVQQQYAFIQRTYRLPDDVIGEEGVQAKFDKSSHELRIRLQKSSDAKKKRSGVLIGEGREF